jgi:hypothetical protein
MQALRPRSGNDRRGAALLYTMFASLAAASMTALIVTVSHSADRSSKTARRTLQSRCLAEGAVEAGVVDVSTAIAQWRPVPTAGTVTIDGQAVGYTVAPTGFTSVEVDSSGIQTILTGYQINASAAVENSSSVSNRLINTHETPLFQFAVFYNTDLEINPGPNMTLGGRVHSNADMYLNCGKTLTLNTNYVRAAGGIYRHRKDDPSLSEGTVKVRNWVSDPYDPSEPLSYFNMNSKAQMAALGIATTSGYDSNFTSAWDPDANGIIGSPPTEWLPWTSGALDYWKEPTGYAYGGHTVMDANHGVSPAAVPDVGSIQMYEPVANGTHYFDSGTGTYQLASAGSGTHSPGYYHSKADLIVITFDDGSLQITTGAGVDVTSSLAGSVVTTGSMYDARQAQGGPGNVAVTNIDLGLLKNTSLWPANGLIYAAHYGAGTGTAAKGVRLVNGAELKSPLSVVTENSIYVKGDFNTVNKVGASVIADAVNLLSNSWNDSNKAYGSSLPTASPTTYNMAIVAGNTTTVGSVYNGGLENLPRFHEKWTNVDCVITGSFVNTWPSVYANAPWEIGGNFYDAPRRKWTYETNFNSVGNLPPFTPMAVSVDQVVAW